MPAGLIDEAADSSEGLPEGPASAEAPEPESVDPADPPAGAEAFERREAVVDAALHGQRLDKALVAIAPEFSRSHLQHLIEAGHVRIGAAGAPGGPAAASIPNASRRLKAGERIVLELVPTDESRAFRPEPMRLVILHEDEDLLVLDKPAGLVVHPAPGHWAGTLVNGLLAHHAAAATLPRAGVVHRLDKDTSGVMMVGKSLPAVTALVRDIAARRVHRRYVALAHGEPGERSMTIDAPIGRDPRSRIRMAVVPVAAGGRAARTDALCLASRVIEGRAFSAWRCTLHTGRTHQIRVHLASRGHPLVADALYGGAPALGLERQALHAVRLEFEHPVSRRRLVFHCAPPPDFATGWARVAGATITPE